MLLGAAAQDDVFALALLERLDELGQCSVVRRRHMVTLVLKEGSGRLTPTLLLVRLYSG